MSFTIREKNGLVTYGALAIEEPETRGFIPQISIETEGGHTVRFLADIVIPTNVECMEFCHAVHTVLSNPGGDPEEVEHFT